MDFPLCIESTETDTESLDSFSIYQFRQYHLTRSCNNFAEKPIPIMTPNKFIGKLFWAGLFAIAMAYVEAAVVVYLRRIWGIEDLMSDVSSIDVHLGIIEIGRELATLMMLLGVGFIAGNRMQSRLGYALFSFGVWDIFYYVWLKIFLDWPHSLAEWDILFLIPLPWWGPIWAPLLIALTMAIWGIFLIILDKRGKIVRIKLKESFGLATGVLILLVTFMKDALLAIPDQLNVVHSIRPSGFLWQLFLAGYSLALFLIINISRRPLK